tara:strand:- start:1489 stop:1653 length:165 start_codon:yes stop_codon:yes gene_type:complete
MIIKNKLIFVHNKGKKCGYFDFTKLKGDSIFFRKLKEDKTSSTDLYQLEKVLQN